MGRFSSLSQFPLQDRPALGVSVTDNRAGPWLSPAAPVIQYQGQDLPCVLVDSLLRHVQLTVEVQTAIRVFRPALQDERVGVAKVYRPVPRPVHRDAVLVYVGALRIDLVYDMYGT